MEARAKFSGRSIHSVLIHLPLALLSTGVIFDFAHLMGGGVAFTRASYYLVSMGLLCGTVAAFFGWIDLLAISGRSRAYNVGIVHGVVNTIVLALFGASLYFRANAPGDPEILSTMFSTMGTAFAFVGCCLGGELMERLSDAAHLDEHSDTPISLSLSHAAHPQVPHHRRTAIAVRR